MKKLLFSLLCPLALVFAGPYDIEEFTATDAGVPDNYIAAEFGGELTQADPNSVGDIQEGRLFVRQKFEDPFGADETTYQLYQGQAGEGFSEMTALSAEGVDYSKLVHAKFYEKRGADAKDDVAKVYFDGKSVFAEGLTTLIAFVDGSPITLKGATPEEAAPVAAATNDEEECDEDDEECEEDEDYSSYDVAGNVDATNEAADNDDNQYAASDAAEEATNRFGIADEVRFWAAVGLSAVAATAAVVGIMKHMSSNDAKSAYDDQTDLVDQVKDAVSAACATSSAADCEAATLWYLKEKNINMTTNDEGSAEAFGYADLLSRQKKNKDTMNSYATARNIWFGISAASLAGAIVLFTW